MAETYMDLNYSMKFTDKEMRLVLLGLAGKIKRREDVEAAQDLNIRLLKSVQHRLREKSDVITGALSQALAESVDPNPGEPDADS